MKEFHDYFHRWKEISGNEGKDRISSSDENLIEIFIKEENKSEYFHRIVPISTDSSGFMDRKKIVWIQRRSSFPLSCKMFTQHQQITTRPLKVTILWVGGEF